MTRAEYPPCKRASVSAPPFADAICRRASIASEYSRVPGRRGGRGRIAARRGAWGVAPVTSDRLTSEIFSAFPNLASRPRGGTSPVGGMKMMNNHDVYLTDHQAARSLQREGEREQLRFECMRLAANLPDAFTTDDVVKNGNAIFAAVTGAEGDHGGDIRPGARVRRKDAPNTVVSWDLRVITARDGHAVVEAFDGQTTVNGIPFGIVACDLLEVVG